MKKNNLVHSPRSTVHSNQKRIFIVLFLFCLLWTVDGGPSTVFAADKSAASNVAAAEWQTHFTQGITSGREGDWDKAIESLEKAATLKPGKSEIYTDLSLAYSEKKNFDQAVEYGTKAVQADANLSTAHLALGLAYEGKSNSEEAIKSYKKAASLEPNNSDIQLTLGNLYGKQAKYDDALAAYERSIKVDPTNLFA